MNRSEFEELLTGYIPEKLVAMITDSAEYQGFFESEKLTLSEATDSDLLAELSRRMYRAKAIPSNEISEFVVGEINRGHRRKRGIR